MNNPINEEKLEHVTGGYSTVKDEDVLKEMKLPDFSLDEIRKLEESELKKVSGGLHNMPKVNPDEKYVLKVRLPGDEEDKQMINTASGKLPR